MQYKKILFYSLLILIPSVFIGLIYAGLIVYRAKPLYSYVKSKQRGWNGKVHKSDPELGLAPIPGAQGEHVFPVGSNIPMRYDPAGFRVPYGSAHSVATRPLVLSLGCSFTYGDAVRAEDTYSYLLGRYLGGTSINAGVCSYGLSQMLLLARKLVPMYKPDFLVVQYSPWLVDRAVNSMAETYFGKIPTPYFYKQNGLKIQSPVFQTIVPDLPVDTYRKSLSGAVDFISFVWEVGVPLFLHDDYNMVVYGTKKLMRMVPKPVSDLKLVASSVYLELAEIAKKNNAKLVIVVIGHDDKPVQVLFDRLPGDVIVVNAHEALRANLPVADLATYRRTYNHWRGNPPVLVDNHPNEAAHKIIAEEIARKISPLSAKMR
jgi:hypothetical protein